jgi:glycosyltransferase involved in cell wall biosynthesis
MKIALLGPIDHFGGGPRIVLELYRVYSKKHDVDIITDFYDRNNTFGEFKQFRIKQLQYKFSKVPFLRRFTAVTAWLNLDLSGYDFAISMHPYSNMTALRNRNVIVYLISLRTLFQSYVWSSYPGLLKLVDYALTLPFIWIEKKAVKKCSCVTTVSEYCTVKSMKYYGLKAEVVPHGIPVSEFYRAPSEDFCIYVGRLSPEKRVDLPIKAWPHVQNNLKLYIIGSGEPRYTGYLKSIAKDNPRIVFTGPLEGKKLKDMFAKCLCVIYVTKEEDRSQVPMEALASGKPAIVADEGGLPETVRDNIDGFVINPTPENIADKVNFLYKNMDITEKMGTNGMERAKIYDWELIADQFMNLAKKLDPR